MQKLVEMRNYRQKKRRYLLVFLQTKGNELKHYKSLQTDGLFSSNKLTQNRRPPVTGVIVNQDFERGGIIKEQLFLLMKCFSSFPLPKTPLWNWIVAQPSIKGTQRSSSAGSLWTQRRLGANWNQSGRVKQACLEKTAAAELSRRFGIVSGISVVLERFISTPASLFFFMLYDFYAQ